MPRTIKIQFGVKFCQIDLDEIISKYWNDSIGENSSEVIFDLTITEWINTEEVAFLFGWIRNVYQLGKRIKVVLPFPYNVKTLNKYSVQELQNLKTKYGFEETEKRIERRKRRNIFLRSVWGIMDRVVDNKQIFENADFDSKSVDLVKAKYTHKVIPFHVVDTKLQGGELKFDTQYEDVLSGIKSKNNSTQTRGLFQLESEIISTLKTYACYSPFESKIISNIITQELYSNASQHSNTEKNNFESECYFTSALNNKWGNPSTSNFTDQFVKEKNPETLDFYRDKLMVLKEVEKKFSEATKEQTENFSVKREAIVKDSKAEFKNISYLEFTFLDFGVGVHATLQEEFGKAKNNFLKAELSRNYETKNLHSQILEYAFLMDSSRIPFDKSIEYYELIPRGLYFLIDMVRRYNGLIIARSGYGKVVYDFSKKVFVKKNSSGKLVASIDTVYEIRDAVRTNFNEKEIAFFPGTMISIVLPEKKKEDLKLSPVRINDKKLAEYIYHNHLASSDPEKYPKQIFAPETYEYISLVFLYEDVLNEIKYVDLNETKVLYNKLFAKLIKKLNDYHGKNCLIFIDFDFMPMRHVFLKILYYLTNTPKINEYTKAVIFNLDDEEEKIIQECKVNLRKPINQPFIYRPIPCLRINNQDGVATTGEPLNINWIGIRDVNHEEMLTQLLIGKTKSGKEVESIARDKFNFNSRDGELLTDENIEGNIFVKDDARVYSAFSDLNELKIKFGEARKKFIVESLINLIEDGTNPKKHPKDGKYIFLTSKGAYQNKYLSLYETLHNKYIARYFAKYLLDKYIENAKKKSEVVDWEEMRFDKIVTVTVSSQLIGVAIRDLIKEKKKVNGSEKYLYPEYSFLLHPEKKTPPELIMLSSYYSFDSEKPFARIKDKNRIILVNDVISTGSLVYRLHNKISRKGAVIKSIMTVADSRIPNDEIDNMKEVECEFKKELNDLFINLVAFEDGLELRKFKENSENLRTKRINPLLNTVIELKLEHSEEERILFPEPKDFIHNKEFKAEYFKIGHFQQNLTHNSYLTDMQNLFLHEKGEEILIRLKKVIQDKFHQTNLSPDDSVRVYLLNLKENIENIKREKSSTIHSNNLIQEIESSLQILNNELDSVSELNITGELEALKKQPSKLVSFSPDFIFYPVFSGIEQVSHSTFSKVFNTDIDNIIGLQRFDTVKGWRFPFPPKRLNKITKGKTVLIIDSGSLTGESLIQLIDSISFLDVGKIYFLSVIGRVEDFYREFYSRMKALKVKYLRSRNEDEEEEREKFPQHVIPINIFFGINLHIPVFPSSVSCPFCEEIKYLENIKVTHLSDPTETVRNYITDRKAEISEVNFGNIASFSFPEYIPRIKNSEAADMVNIFLMRDKIGRIDSYRFYPDYFQFFDDLIKAKNDKKDNWYKDDEIKTQIEQILTCIIHEPKLKEVVRDLLVEIKALCIDYLDLFFTEKKVTISEFYYDWQTTSLIRAYYYLNLEKFFELECLENLLLVADVKANNYLNYIFWDLLFYKYSPKETKDDVESLLIDFGKKYLSKDPSNDVRIYSNEGNYRIAQIVQLKYSIEEIGQYQFFDKPYYNLMKFFLKGAAGGRHNKVIELFGEVYKHSQNLEINKEEFCQKLGQGLEILNHEIVPSLRKIGDDNNIKKYFDKEIYELINDSEKGILNAIKKLESLHNGFLDKGSIENSELVSVGENCKNFNFNFLQEDQPFPKHCIDYPCNIIPTMLKVNSFWKESFGRNNIKIDTKNLRVSRNLKVAMPTIIVSEMFQELYKNVEQRYKKDVTIEVAANEIDHSERITFVITQDKPFKDKNGKPISSKDVLSEIRQGGLTNIVKYFMEKFAGAYNDVKEENNFTIELTFKLHEYASGKN